MNSLLQLVPVALRPGDVVSAKVLTRHHAADNDIRRACRRGELIPLRRGWYAGPNAHPEVVRAVRAGGVLGCVSALVFRGAWDIHDNRLHTYRSAWGRTKSPGRVGWCWCPATRIAPVVGVVSLDLALTQAVFCASSENFLVMTESLIHRGLLTRQDTEAHLRGLGARADALLRKLDVAESGTETMVRLRLRRRNIRVRPQVVIPGIGRVDFLVGDRLVLEVDSQEHHRTAEAYQRDRRRDQLLQAMGYAVMRVTWEQVMFHWPETEATILAFVRRRRHCRRLG